MAEFSLIKMFEGVDKKWRDLLLDKNSGMDNMLLGIVKTIQSDNMTPKCHQILEFARQTPLDSVRVVIMGQDPYFTPGTAHGLCFSTQDYKCPPSLRKMFGAMVKSGIMKEPPKTYDLTSWARQGILMMNSAWTTTIGSANKHQDCWNPYVSAIIKKLSDVLPRTVWLLWGKDAQSKGALIDAKKHDIRTFCHPVAYPPNDFTDCKHFEELVKSHGIIWDPTPRDSHWHTDGACSNNQNAAKARAAWGVKCTKGPHAGKKFGGPVPLATVEKWDAKLGKNVEADARPTNIRAEGLALINAMELIRNTGLTGKHVISSDSKFWIVDMYKTYIPKWIAAKSQWAEHQNSDLTKRFWELTQLINQRFGSLEFNFVNAWHDWTPKTDDEKYWWQGNHDAEKAAEENLPKQEDDLKAKSFKKFNIKPGK